MMIRSLAPAAVLTLLLLAGCTVGPDYARPELEAEVPEEWTGQVPEPAVTMAQALPDSQAAAGGQWRWWESFADTTLNGLVEDALVFNNDLAAAAGRVLEARALLGGAKSAQWPSVEIGGMAGRSKSSEALTQGFGPIYQNQFSADATLRYEIDLWGRLARGTEAARATLIASEQDRRAVAQALIADVVRTWLVIRELQLQVALTERTIENFTDNLTTVRERYRRGLVSALDVHLASQNLAAAQSADPAFRQELASARRRLEILVGRYPAGDLIASDLEGPGGGLTAAVMPDPLEPVPAGLPSELLERRPDLMAAEMRLHSSVARVGEAKAALYPRLPLTATGGSKSTDLSDLFQSGTDFWSITGSLFMPLINRGATQAQIKAAEARVIQATAGYKQSILVAFSEVENALDQDLYQARQEEYLTDSAEQARRSVNLAQDRYRRGLDSLLVTLESQRRLFNAESQLLTTQRARRSARVNLIQALGGPWDLEPVPTTVSMTSDDSNEGAQQ
jgi:multidrug efflux system outer membrane protein